MECKMKRIIIPVSSLVLLAGLSAQAAPPDNSQKDHKQASHAAAPARHPVAASHPALRGSTSVLQTRVTRGVPMTSGSQHHVTSARVTSHHVTSHYVQSHHATSHHITTYHVTSHPATGSHVAVHVSTGNRAPLHFDPRRYHHNYTATHRFHAAIYVRPQGWYYRRWSYGQTFPQAFYARDYWISDYQAYGLIDPPEDCQWVRYDNDAVLVDIDTGDILQVIYNFYY
jgi:Ni/Co efflux regulator RcnB